MPGATQAGDLRPGNELVTPDGARVRVIDIVAYKQLATVHNLTVTDIHTYYVIAGNTPVLVHNCGEAIVHLDPDAKHALITVKNGDEVLHTEQFGGVNTPTNGVAEFDPATLSPNTINVRIPIPNPGGRNGVRRSHDGEDGERAIPRLQSSYAELCHLLCSGSPSRRRFRHTYPYEGCDRVAAQEAWLAPMEADCRSSGDRAHA